MTKFNAPEGYLPYRLFNYHDAESGMDVVLRPEQFIGAVKGMESDSGVWTVQIAVRDGNGPLTVRLGTEGRCSHFISTLVSFIEADALRNTHNAVMRKGKTHE